MHDPTDQQLVLQTIRDVAGEAGLKAVRAARGGTDAWIPLDPAPDHWLSLALGHKAAQETSRRLTLFDADGKRVCNMHCYISLGLSRIQEFKAQIISEICEALLSGLGSREVALKLRVSERDVQKQRSYLVAVGQLSPRPLGRKRGASSPAAAQAIPDERKTLWEIKASIVDEAVLKGESNRRIATSAQVGLSYVRSRRKHLLASGRLKPGRISAPIPPLDHSADIGEMVLPSREVRP